MTKALDTPTRPAIRCRSELDAVVANVLDLRRERASIEDAEAKEIAAVRARYEPEIARVGSMIQQESSWIEMWVSENPQIVAGGLLDLGPALIGYVAGEPRVEKASRKWNWAEIIDALRLVPATQRYVVAGEPVVDKDAILADLRDRKCDLVSLREAGIKVVGEKRFTILEKAPVAA